MEEERELSDLEEERELSDLEEERELSGLEEKGGIFPILKARIMPPYLEEEYNTNRKVSEVTGYRISPALIEFVSKFEQEAKKTINDKNDFMAINKQTLELFNDYFAKQGKTKINAEIQLLSNEKQTSRNNYYKTDINCSTKSMIDSEIKTDTEKIVFEDLEKKYETYLDRSKVTIFRLDGHSFSKFTSHFKKPFDDTFTQAMKQTALKAFDYYNFSLGFVGSDEITFCIFPKKRKNGELCEIEFSGRVEKMTTLLAGYVSIVFYKEFNKIYPMDNFFPHFDCRVYQVDKIADALQNISSRVTYTLKNSRMMFAQNYFSAKQLHKLSSKQAVELVLSELNIDFYQMVGPDIRVGTVIINDEIECEKDVSIKGTIHTINYIRKNSKMLNLSATEVLDLAIE